MRQQAKPTVLFLAHAETGHLLQDIVDRKGLKKHISVRTAIAHSDQLEGIQLSTVEKQLAAAQLVVLGTCRQSMYRQCGIYRAEAQMIEYLRGMRTPIVLFVTDPKCFAPPYLEGMHDRVKMLFTIGDRIPARARKLFPTADHFDLLQLPRGESPHEQTFFRRERELECIPHNIVELGWQLSKISGQG